ncbi:response regulator [Nocardia otitidiscaviarum]|uniref:Response regulator n=1 Tax=Nocardia otitidiscaviarum TaxID=1823 RepID=A0A516NHU1_9NOCA|nr:response regulator [Nocardia otitidiscaviarum]QDP78465.1 response regulator [Nocardia otitidiscaviarum]
MGTGMRILVASPLGKVVEPILRQAPGVSKVAVAADRRQVLAAITDTVRFDVVVADLIWNKPELEYTFDGLDVVDMVALVDRDPRVLLAAQGHTMEQDHLDEARLSPAVVGVFEKSAGVDVLLAMIRTAAVAPRRGGSPTPGGPRSLYECFQSKRGATAGRMAGAIAAGRATDASSLAHAAGVGRNTANKITNVYLGPIIRERAEHDPALPLTLGAVYRWCGLHSRYLVSWCRRNGYPEVLRAGQRSPGIPWQRS